MKVFFRSGNELLSRANELFRSGELLFRSRKDLLRGGNELSFGLLISSKFTKSIVAENPFCPVLVSFWIYGF
jgi:hypothetical protein